MKRRPTAIPEAQVAPEHGFPWPVKGAAKAMRDKMITSRRWNGREWETYTAPEQQMWDQIHRECPKDKP